MLWFSKLGMFVLISWNILQNRSIIFIPLTQSIFSIHSLYPIPLSSCMFCLVVNHNVLDRALCGLYPSWIVKKKFSHDCHHIECSLPTTDFYSDMPHSQIYLLIFSCYFPTIFWFNFVEENQPYLLTFYSFLHSTGI